MNGAAIMLMLVTATGIQTGPSFQTFEECEAISANIKSQETFCYYQEPVDLDQAFATMDKMLLKMQESMNGVRQQD